MAVVAFVLKPLLEREANGLISAALYVDTTESTPLGITGVSTHATEAEARAALQAAIEQHLLLKDAVISIDGIEFGRDVPRAMAALVLEAGSDRAQKPVTVNPPSKRRLAPSAPDAEDT